MTSRQITDTDSGPVWLEERRRGIGGTDCLILMGEGQYEDETPYFVWLKKVEGYKVPSNLAMRRGHELEPLVADRYVEETGHSLIETGMWAHPKHPEILGSPDRLVVDEDGNWIGGFEAKTTLDRTARKWGSECPARFEWQVRHYMSILDLPWFDVAVLVVDTWEVLYWRVERDMAKERALIAACTEFWRTYVVPRIPPEPDALMSAAEVAARYSVVGEKTLDLDPFSDTGWQVVELTQERRMLQERVKADQKRLERIDISLKDIAGEHEEVVVDGQRAYTWRQQTRTSIDGKRLREELPEVAAEYERSSTYRVLRFD